jgi:hypothetical protein
LRCLLAAAVAEVAVVAAVVAAASRIFEINWLECFEVLLTMISLKYWKLEETGSGELAFDRQAQFLRYSLRFNLSTHHA